MKKLISLFLLFHFFCPILKATDNAFLCNKNIYSNISRHHYIHFKDNNESIKKKFRRRNLEFNTSNQNTCKDKVKTLKNQQSLNLLSLPDDILCHLFSFTRGKDFDNLGWCSKRLNFIQNNPKLLHLKSIPYLSNILLYSKDKSVFFKSDHELILKRLKTFRKKLRHSFLLDINREILIRNWNIVYNSLKIIGELEGNNNEVELLEENFKYTVKFLERYIRSSEIGKHSAFKREYTAFAQLCCIDTRPPGEVAQEYNINNQVLSIYKKNYP